MIAIRDLTIRYGRSTALAELTMRVEPGQVFALLGRNGAGKSTLFRALLGQRLPDSGSIRVIDLDPWESREALMAQVGATPESPDAPARLRLNDLAKVTAAVHGRWNRAAFQARLERFGISVDRPFGDLSRGQKSLVQLALALGHDPTLLLLDDPTLGLDPVARRFFFDELLTELAERGITVLLSTHDVDAASRIASHVGVLAGGRLIREGTIDEVRGDLSLEDRLVDLVGREESAS